jgi:hypothetical protein
MVFAQEEARALGHNHIGTEHLLLGLIREQEGLAAQLLQSLGVPIEEARARVAREVPQADEVVAADPRIPFTPRAKKVLELSLREALSLGHDWIGTEHILLGLVPGHVGTREPLRPQLRRYSYGFPGVAAPGVRIDRGSTHLVAQASLRRVLPPGTGSRGRSLRSWGSPIRARYIARVTRLSLAAPLPACLEERRPFPR